MSVEKTDDSNVFSDVSGQIFCRVKSESAPDDGFYILGLNFFGADDLTRVAEFIAERGWMPFTDTMNLKIIGFPAEEDVYQEDGPGCPYHGAANVRSSKRKGYNFCATQLKDGSWCKWTEKA